MDLNTRFAQPRLRPADITRVRKAANQAIDHQAATGVLVQINVGRRNRAFEAPELIDAFTALERQLASPAGDTGE